MILMVFSAAAARSLNVMKSFVDRIYRLDEVKFSSISRNSATQQHREEPNWQFQFLMSPTTDSLHSPNTMAKEIMGGFVRTLKQCGERTEPLKSC